MKRSSVHEIQVISAIKPKYAKTKIPKAVREQVWLRYFGKTYEHSCHTRWCQNIISVFDFHVGHDQPESKGGSLEISNLKPICARCNLSMSDNYTIQEWSSKISNKRRWCRIFCC